MKVITVSLAMVVCVIAKDMKYCTLLMSDQPTPYEYIGTLTFTQSSPKDAVTFNISIEMEHVSNAQCVLLFHKKKSPSLNCNALLGSKIKIHSRTRVTYFNIMNGRFKGDIKLPWMTLVPNQPNSINGLAVSVHKSSNGRSFSRIACGDVMTGPLCEI